MIAICAVLPCAVLPRACVVAGVGSIVAPRRCIEIEKDVSAAGKHKSVIAVAEQLTGVVPWLRGRRMEGQGGDEATIPAAEGAQTWG
jgi:hypothetical protein